MFLVGTLISLGGLPLLAQWSPLASSLSPASGAAPINQTPTMGADSLQASTVLTGQNPTDDPGYLGVIQRTVSMVSNTSAQRLADELGLDILDITWEDTGRFKNSAVGPNISDMTIQVQHKNPRNDSYSLHLMPVIRFPNFADKTADIPLDQLYINVGNEKGRSLRKVPLQDVLGNLRRYLTRPSSWKGQETSLLAPRDSHALVSAQAAFLPIPKGGEAQFNPVLFNYQSYAKNPAVLTLLATREGTSVTVIDNQRDGFEAGRTWGQRLFFNQQGERASFTGQRISDFQSSTPGGNRPNQDPDETEGLNMVMLIQVPLKQKPQARQQFSEGGGGVMPLAAPTMEKSASDVEAAVIGHGEVEGPFTEIDNLAIERDPRFPIRVTVQFYKGTSNGEVSRADLQQIRDQIDQVYADADYIGSLVVEGETRRPTEYEGPKHEPPGWWDDFWRRHEANTGQSREEAIQMLRKLRGKKWYPLTEEELNRNLQQIPQRSQQ
ncbi:hypothetical protein [Lyngbya confervoides]|uniref:Uncharacterized protein n=1 Tax=Lyngbya confervoides BDU141951 TaxID=1574623 RepID=A0ABD4T5Y3_9CYAN|nr:hypothetical protein [Lyngbya confervoides]MCM1983880.1 hypothetical protein [Lyngbya confervoides BDU141951]